MFRRALRCSRIRSSALGRLPLSMARTTASKEAVVCALLVPARASPVPSVVRGFLVKFFFRKRCTCVSASARQSRAQCCAREFCCKILFWCTCVSASARQSRAQCRAREFGCKILSLGSVLARPFPVDCRVKIIHGKSTTLKKNLGARRLAPHSSP